MASSVKKTKMMAGVADAGGSADGLVDEGAEPSPKLDAARPEGARRGVLPRLVILVGVIGLAGFTVMRVRQKNGENARLAAERAETAQRAKAPKVRERAALVAAQAGRWRPEVVLDGTLQAAQETDLAFKIPGRLAALRVKVGNHVERGQVLATLDATEAQAQLAAAEAQIKVVEAQLALADDSERRTTSLVGSGVASQATGQRALVAAQLEAARAQTQLARANVTNCTLAAPFAGYVTRVPSGPGGFLNPGMPGVAPFHLQDTTKLKLAGTVGEAEAALIKPGAAVAIDAGGRRVAGTVTSVLGSVEPMTRRVPVEALVDNALEPPLLAGSFVRATARSGGEIDVVTLPTSAVRPGSQDEVLVVSEGRARVRRVSFVPGPDGSILVRAGLSAGESVLAHPSPEAKDGDAVE